MHRFRALEESEYTSDLTDHVLWPTSQGEGDSSVFKVGNLQNWRFYLTTGQFSSENTRFK